jgi:hypothetical protein
VIFGRQTNAIAAFLAICIDLAVSFGLNLTVVQIGLLNAGMIAGLALLANSNSTPTSDPRVPIGTDVTVVTPAGQPNKVVTLDPELVRNEGTPAKS